MRYSSRRHVEVARSQSNADANITCGCMLILLIVVLSLAHRGATLVRHFTILAEHWG